MTNEILTLQKEVLSSLGFLLVLTGPTASGKTSIINRLLADRPDFKKVVTATTRSPRPGEREGVDYYFKSREVFLQEKGNGKFLEDTEHGGNLYGTPIKGIEGVFGGQNLVVSLDIKGALAFYDNVIKEYGFEKAKGLIDRTLVVLVGVESIRELRTRYKKRQGDTKEEREQFKERMDPDWNKWKDNKDRFKTVVMNRDGRLDEAVSQVEKLLKDLKDCL